MIRVALQPISDPILAIVDTAATWCVFNWKVGTTLAQSFEPIPGRSVVSTRLGLFRGSLYRIPLRLDAEEGEFLEVEATVFLSPDWTGPNFIGYQGLLQRIRFAVDPEANLFYFGQI